MKRGFLEGLIQLLLKQRLAVFIFFILIFLGGLYVIPFDIELGFFPRSPIPVDAIPDIGENQQIVFTEWKGRSPQDVEDQITYPLTVSLLGVSGVKSIRSFSFFGYSSIYVIFEEGVDFYWARSRVLERLIVAKKDLPEDVEPTLGPDATALGQVFWYTLEGKGFSLHELRSIQDWYVRYALASVQGVSEVASVGGYIKEYQIDVNPDALRAYQVTLAQLIDAVRKSNIDVGAKTIEINRVEYLIRGLGFVKTIEDLENIVIKEDQNVPVYVKNVANVVLGPATRRGILDKEGAEVVGGVVVVRYGENPLEVIKRVKKKIKEISLGLPKKTLADGTISQVKIVPFYDRTVLIQETLGTLKRALTDEILITVVVIIILVMHIQSSLLISLLLPLAVLICFIAMKVFRVDSNIMSLSGIAIAIGTVVDMGIIVCENILRHFEQARSGVSRVEKISRATGEVGRAVITAVSTTVIAFLPVFFMTGPEGKLFKPLAYTKTFVLIASVLVAIVVLPCFAYVLFRAPSGKKEKNPFKRQRQIKYVWSSILAFMVVILLTHHWMPLGIGRGYGRNLIFVGVVIGGFLVFFRLFQYFYQSILWFFLRKKFFFFCLLFMVVVFGLVIWQGFERIFSPFIWGLRRIGISEDSVRSNSVWVSLSHRFPGLGKEFMPPLDEGSYLLMPTTMPHAGVEECLDILQKQDMAIRSIPEVDSVVGKIGRVESALDPAPLSMIETVITYKPEYGPPDPITGKQKRLWRSHIKSPEDIWQEIVKAAEILGTTSAPRLQPIAARIVMLQSGMRAPMGIKVFGPSLEVIERVTLDIERLLKEVPSVDPGTVIADRIVGKPYLEIDISRSAISRYGVNIRHVQDVIEFAIGGKRISTIIKGRERYPIRVRYQRELRDSLDSLEQVLIPTAGGYQIPLSQVAEIRYVRGPQVIKSEDTFLVGYVVFDKRPGYAEVDVVEEAREYLSQKIKERELVIPSGVSYRFAGTFEHQRRSERTLLFIIPLSLLIIFIILYFNFRRVSTSLLVFSGIIVAWSGGFILIWFYAQDWFLNFSVFGVNVRQLFQIDQINLSVAVWVGFLALFGIASDDGVVIGTYLEQIFLRRPPGSIEDIRENVVEAGKQRIRPCLLTTATTVLALTVVLTSTGRGADVMVPMAIPCFGGMLITLLSVFVVPVTYCLIKELRFKTKLKQTKEV
jgi:Cu(I)/Ag(I) efflux system membrane protein CusA/SilA